MSAESEWVVLVNEFELAVEAALAALRAPVSRLDDRDAEQFSFKLGRAAPPADAARDEKGAVEVGGWRPDWICEFCYKPADGDLPKDWTLVFQSAECPDCHEKVKRDGGYHVVKGGAYAYAADPRPWPRWDDIQPFDHESEVAPIAPADDRGGYEKGYEHGWRDATTHASADDEADDDPDEILRSIEKVRRGDAR